MPPQTHHNDYTVEFSFPLPFLSKSVCARRYALPLALHVKTVHHTVYFDFRKQEVRFMGTISTDSDNAAPLVQRDYPGIDEAQARIEVLKEAIRDCEDVGIHKPSELTGTETEISEAKIVLQNTLNHALANVHEKDIDLGLEQGWLSKTEAKAARLVIRTHELSDIRASQRERDSLEQE